MASDPLRERITLFGGSALNGGDQTWEWDGTAWTQQEDTGPGFRSECPLAFDAAGERTILFGGSSPSGTETWRLEWEDLGAVERYWTGASI